MGKLSTISAELVRLVRCNQGVDRFTLERDLRSRLDHPALLNRRGEPRYFGRGSHFYNRVRKLVHHGHLVALLVKGMNRYFTADYLPAAFDLADPLARLVAADAVEDGAGPGAVSDALRTARRFTCKE